MRATTVEEGVFLLRLARDDARLREGQIAPLFLFEALCQAAAAFHGATLTGRPESGMLVQADGVRFGAGARGGEDVELRVRRTHALGSLVRFAGRAMVGERLLVEGELTVARDNGSGG